MSKGCDTSSLFDYALVVISGLQATSVMMQSIAWPLGDPEPFNRIFALTVPILNILVAQFFYTQYEQVFFYSETKCTSALHISMFTLGSLGTLAFTIHSVLVAAFQFKPRMKHGGPFACRSGLFKFLFQYAICNLTIFCAVAHAHKFHIIQGVICFTEFVLLALWCLYKQPFYSRLGNATMSVLCTVTSLVGLFATFAAVFSIEQYIEEDDIFVIRTKLPTYGIIIFWAMFFSVIPLLSVVMAYLTIRRGRKLWALGPNNEMLPVFRKKHQNIYGSHLNHASSSEIYRFRQISKKEHQEDIKQDAMVNVKQVNTAVPNRQNHRCDFYSYEFIGIEPSFCFMLNIFINRR
ncbi:MAG: hypothetical protein EZS28_011522 [Streblomastix strix]|uniref:Uncharacterized protein n=1 Tax=Streblomastix strix TaxID=222440 RepID=A0A5J4WDD7_9EUKA|nr:MAG: hypothetical protein EZS28_011522 [Streblomastix strix]